MTSSEFSQTPPSYSDCILHNKLIRMSMTLDNFFKNKGFQPDDYINYFLLHLGRSERIQVTISEINVFLKEESNRTKVIFRTLQEIARGAKQYYCHFDEWEMALMINKLLSGRSGWLPERITKIARSTPYHGEVIPKTNYL